jgi:GTP cyclohydrolase FolE2
MNTPERCALPDIRSVADRRNLPIDRAGVKSLRHPLRVATAGGGEVAAVASGDGYGGLPPRVEATPLPRFVEVLPAERAAIDAPRLDREPRVRAYARESENFESIHNHSACALLERDKAAASGAARAA